MPKQKAKPNSRKPKKASPAKHAPSADEQALLAAVIAHPDEDTPRLMFADWLEENGQPERAEFIRAQIEAARFPPGDPGAKALRARVVELIKQHRKEWKGVATRGVFVRGFLTGICVPYLNAFCHKADKWCARDPIRVVYASDFWRVCAEGEEVDCPQFEQLTGLGSLSGGWGGDAVETALANPRFANLRMIDFQDGDCNGPQAARAIAAAKHLTNLLVLDLTSNRIGDKGLEALAKAKHLQSLQALRLGDGGRDSNNITPDGISALMKSKTLTSLTQLVLEGNELGDKGVERLLAAKWITNLTELDLTATHMEEDGLLMIARTRKLTNLRRLCLFGPAVSERVAQEFLQSEGFSNLSGLTLCNGAVDDMPGDETCAALEKRFGRAVLVGSGDPPTPICWEDKVAWRLQKGDYNTPPALSEDCEAV